MKRLIAPLGLAGAMLMVLVFAVHASSNILTNGCLVGDDTGWSGVTDLYSSIKECGDYSFELIHDEDFYQTVYITVPGVYRQSLQYYTHIASFPAYINEKMYYHDGSSWLKSSEKGHWRGYDPQWFELVDYVGLSGTYTWRYHVDGVNTGKRLVDDMELIYSSAFDKIEGNLLDNGGFDGDLDNWIEVSSGAQSPPYNIRYYAGDKNLEYGALYLPINAHINHGFTVQNSGNYTFGLSVNWVVGSANWAKLTIYDDDDTLIDDITEGASSDQGWQSDSDVVYLEAGEYYARLDGIQTCLVDDVHVSNPALVTEEDPPEWGTNAWIYYPLESYFDLGYYQTYSNTSAYGTPYQYYNIWETWQGATAYAIATMDVVEVGTNHLGYYVQAQIDAWPDVPSTTIIYEGLSSVDVSVGDTVGAQCPVGTVANRWEFGPSTYHLLLGVFFPDESTPFDPRGFMARRPTPGACMVIEPPGGSTTEPGLSAVGLWEPICRDCVAPGLSDLLNAGKWALWLGCVISNLILCWMVRILNSIIIFLAGIWDFGILALGWLTEAINFILELLAMLWNSAVRVAIHTIISSVLDMIFGGDLVQMLWMAKELAIVAAGQLWTLLTGVLNLIGVSETAINNVMEIIVDMIQHMISAFSGTKTDIFDFFGVDTGLGGDPTGIAEGAPISMGEFETQIEATGPNTSKALYVFVLAIGTGDAIIGDTGLVLVTYILMAALGWSVITWTLKQFQEIFSF